MRIWGEGEDGREGKNERVEQGDRIEGHIYSSRYRSVYWSTGIERVMSSCS